MIVSHLMEVVVILTLWFLLSKENKRRDRIQGENEGSLEGQDLDATAFSDMTDRENLKYVVFAAVPWFEHSCVVTVADGVPSFRYIT